MPYVPAAAARSGADDFAGAVAAWAAQNGVQTGGRSAWDIYIAEKKIADAAYNTIRKMHIKSEKNGQKILGEINDI